MSGVSPVGRFLALRFRAQDAVANPDFDQSDSVDELVLVYDKLAGGLYLNVNGVWKVIDAGTGTTPFQEDLSGNIFEVNLTSRLALGAAATPTTGEKLYVLADIDPGVGSATLTVKGKAGQLGALWRVEDSADDPLATVDPTGNMFVAADLDAVGTITAGVDVNAGGDVNSSNNINATADVSAGGDVAATGNVISTTGSVIAAAGRGLFGVGVPTTFAEQLRAFRTLTPSPGVNASSVEVELLLTNGASGGFNFYGGGDVFAGSNGTADLGGAVLIGWNVGAYHEGTGAGPIIAGVQALATAGDPRAGHAVNVGTIPIVVANIYNTGFENTGSGHISQCYGSWTFPVFNTSATRTIAQQWGNYISNQGATGVADSVAFEVAAQSGSDGTNVGIKNNANLLQTTTTIALGANTNDLNTGATSTLRLVDTAGGNIDLTGIVSHQLDGWIITVYNRSVVNHIILRNDSAASAVNNRFLLAGGADRDLGPGGSIMLQYLAGDNRWVQMNT